MTDNELLLAISGMMDEKLDARLIPMGNRIERVENRIERVENRIEQVENRIEQVETGIERMGNRIERVENRTKRIEVDLLENNVIPRLNTIESCYTDTYNRYKDYTEKMDDAFADIDLLKKVVSDHSEKLKKIS